MKTIRLLSLALLPGIAACEDTSDGIPAGKGKIVLTTNWDDRGDGVDVPAAYKIEAAGVDLTVPGEVNPTGLLLDAGTYHLSLYSVSGKMSVSGSTASVEVVDAPAGATGIFIDPLPGWFFTATKELKVAGLTNTDATAWMYQRTRALTLALLPTGDAAGKVSSLTVTLGGVAATLDIASGEVAGEASVRLLFERQADGCYTATTRLLGIAGTVQTLTVKVELEGSGIEPFTVTSDLTPLLATFNMNKREPLTLSAQMILTPTGAGLGGTINDWQQVIAGQGIAEP
jgi:hypothetical protein